MLRTENNLKNKKFKRITLALCICFVAVSLFAQIYIIINANHDCFGDGCAICEQLNNAKTFLKNIGAAFSVLLVTLSILSALIIRVIKYIFAGIFTANPVALKVKINN